MGIKNAFLLVFFFLIFNTCFIQDSSGSLSPIIEALAPQIFVELNQEFTITWIIIDDDPSRYEIRQDNSLLKWGQIETSMINITSSMPIGVYYYAIIVFDYTGNSISNVVQINVVSPHTVTSPTSSYTQDTKPSFTSADEAAARGFSLLIVIFVILTSLIIERNVFHKGDKRKRY
jgi:hypothetical protein